MFLSYLPLAHIFDRVAEELFLAISARIGYWQGSAKTLMDDVATLRPTIFVGVPRIFDRLYSGVTSKVRHLAQLLGFAARCDTNFVLPLSCCSVTGDTRVISNAQLCALARSLTCSCAAVLLSP